MSRSGVGNNVILIRERRMWTQSDLAVRAGVSPTTISGIERGRISNPHFGTIRKLARALDVTPEELTRSRTDVGREGPEPMSLAWAAGAQEEEFEQRIEDATLEGMNTLSKELDDERGRLRELYGKFPANSEQQRLIKSRIRQLSAHSGSLNTSIEFRTPE